MSRLVNKETGEVVKRGDHLTTFRGELFILDEWRDPLHAGSSGRVYGKVFEGDRSYCGEFFPGVVGCRIVGHEYETA